MNQALTLFTCFYIQAELKDKKKREYKKGNRMKVIAVRAPARPELERWPRE